MSKFFSKGQLKGLNRLGDVVLPGTERLPSYSQTGCASEIDRLAAWLSAEDLAGLKLAFGLCRWLPRPGIGLLLKMATANRLFPGPLGAGLRLLEIGLKGATMSLYYSNVQGADYTGARVFEVLGYHLGPKDGGEGHNS